MRSVWVSIVPKLQKHFNLQRVNQDMTNKIANKWFTTEVMSGFNDPALRNGLVSKVGAVKWVEKKSTATLVTF